MYKIKIDDMSKLKKFNFKRYNYGYCKKLSNSNEYDFIDIAFSDLLVKKCKFVDDHFEETYAERNDILDLIKSNYVRAIKDEKN